MRDQGPSSDVEWLGCDAEVGRNRNHHFLLSIGVTQGDVEVTWESDLGIPQFWVRRAPPSLWRRRPAAAIPASRADASRVGPRVLHAPTHPHTHHTHPNIAVPPTKNNPERRGGEGVKEGWVCERGPIGRRPTQSPHSIGMGWLGATSR